MVTPRFKHSLTVLRDSLRLNEMSLGYVAEGGKMYELYSRRIKDLTDAIATLENARSMDATADSIEESL